MWCRVCCRYGEYVEQDAEEAAKRAASATVREEWILDPGSNKLISGKNQRPVM